MSLENRVSKLEAAQLQTGADGEGCERCRDNPYLPDAVNTENVYYNQVPCEWCGRLWTLCIRVIYGDERQPLKC